MDSYTTGYNRKSWSNNSFDHAELSGVKLNKKGGKARSFQWCYTNKNKFKTPNGTGIKKKKPKNNYKLKDISKRNSLLSDMYFKERSQSSLPNGSSVNERTIVDIVDSDLEICYGETNYNKKMKKRKKMKVNSSPVIPDNNNTKEMELFYFDIYGNQSTQPSTAKHLHFGDNCETLGNSSPNSPVHSIQSNIQKSKKERNVFNKPNYEELLSPTSVKPKKRKESSVTSVGASTSQKEFNLEDGGNALITEIKESPKTKKSKHCMEYEPSNSASESFVGIKHVRSANIKSEKNVGADKNDSASNIDDDKMRYLKPLVKTTTDTHKLRLDALIDALSEMNPNNASSKNNIDNITDFNMKKSNENSIIIKKKEKNHMDFDSRKESPAKNKKKKKFSEEDSDTKIVCASEWESNDDRSFINSNIDCDNSVTERKRKKKKFSEEQGDMKTAYELISSNVIDSIDHDNIVKVKNKKKKKFSEECGDTKTVCASELESSDSINCNNIVTDRKKKKKKFSEEYDDTKTTCTSELKSSDGRSIINSNIDYDNTVTVKKKKKKKFSEECDTKTVCASELESRDGISIINSNIDCNNSVTDKKKKKKKFSEEYDDTKTVCVSELENSNGRSIINSNIVCDNSVIVKKKKESNHSDKFSEEYDTKTVCVSELESCDGRSVINSMDSNKSVKKKKKRSTDCVVLNKENKSSNSFNKDYSEPNTSEITAFSDTCDLLEKDEVIEETYNELMVNASKVCKQYDEFKAIYDSYPVESNHSKLSIEDVYTDESNDEFIDESNDESIDESNDESIKAVTKKSKKRLAKLKQDLDKDEIQTLSELEIVLPFDTIPPLHDIQRPSKPTPKELRLAKQLNAKLGPFGKHEDEQIITNWENFCEDHDLSLKPSVFFKFHRSVPIRTKIKFLQYLSHKLDNRHPVNVHSRFQRLFSNIKIKIGRFTKEEDEKIMKYVNKNKSKTPYRDLGILLGRSSKAINRRYYILIEKRRRYKVTWNLRLSERLIEKMLEVTGLKSVEDLEHVTIHAGQWRKLSILLDNISEGRLRRAWFLNVHPRLFSKETNHIIKRDLIKMMLVNKERDFRTVNWKKYSDNFNGINEKKLYEMFVNMMRQYVPSDKWTSLRSVVKYLSKITCNSRNILRYIYKDGKLEVK